MFKLLAEQPGGDEHDKPDDIEELNEGEEEEEEEEKKESTDWADDADDADEVDKAGHLVLPYSPSTKVRAILDAALCTREIPPELSQVQSPIELLSIMCRPTLQDVLANQNHSKTVADKKAQIAEIQKRMDVLRKELASEQQNLEMQFKAQSGQNTIEILGKFAITKSPGFYSELPKDVMTALAKHIPDCVPKVVQAREPEPEPEHPDMIRLREQVTKAQSNSTFHAFVAGVNISCPVGYETIPMMKTIHSNRTFTYIALDNGKPVKNGITHYLVVKKSHFEEYKSMLYRVLHGVVSKHRDTIPYWHPLVRYVSQEFYETEGVKWSQSQGAHAAM